MALPKLLQKLFTNGGAGDKLNPDILPDFATVATSGNYNDLIGKPTLATVATSGNYNDLSGKPTIPVITSGTTDLTAGTSALATGAVYLLYE